ncbi:response regulator [Magnetovibrio sp.]|uniref:response regulator n=1 Tax=Magnetovibrio sp. TaxID=2024836 RepID=UPI002F94CBDC
MPKTDFEYGNKSVLVIEDVPSMRQLLALLLHEIGFDKVLTCEDGAEALKLVESTTSVIDVIVCDLEMPIIGGLEFIQMLRHNKHSQHAGVPVVVLTGHSEQANLHKAVKLGINSFLVKPVSRKILEEHIRRAMTHGQIEPDVLSKKSQIKRKGFEAVKIIEG